MFLFFSLYFVLQTGFFWPWIVQYWETAFMFTLHLTYFWSLQNQDSATEDFIPCVYLLWGFICLVLILSVAVILLWLCFRVWKKTCQAVQLQPGVKQWLKSVSVLYTNHPPWSKIHLYNSRTFQDLRTVLIFVGIELSLLVTLCTVESNHCVLFFPTIFHARTIFYTLLICNISIKVLWPLQLDY